jgi:hypothetical protein
MIVGGDAILEKGPLKANYSQDRYAISDGD